MKSPRMNLFREVARTEKTRARKVSPKGIPFQRIVPVVGIVLVALAYTKSIAKHKAEMADLRAQIAEAEAQVRQIVDMSTVQAHVNRKPASNLKPSGMDGTWTSVLWKFAAFTGERVVIRDVQLTPLAGGGRIQNVLLNGQAASFVEVRLWLERLIENMPGSEFSIQHQKLTEDPDYPVVFSLTAQVI